MRKFLAIAGLACCYQAAVKKGILRKRSTPRLVNRKPVSHYETTMSHSQSSSLNRASMKQALEQGL